MVCCKAGRRMGGLTIWFCMLILQVVVWGAVKVTDTSDFEKGDACHQGRNAAEKTPAVKRDEAGVIVL